MTVGTGNQVQLHALLKTQPARLAAARAATSAQPAMKPAALVATEHLRSTLAYLDAQSFATQRGVAVVDTADAALGQVSDLLVEARVLTVAAANDAGLSDAEKLAGQMQLDSVIDSVDRITTSAQFGGTKLFDGRYNIAAGGASFPVPAVSVEELELTDLKTGGGSSLVDGAVASAAASVDAAIGSVSKTRASLSSFAGETLAAQINVVAAGREQIISAIGSLSDIQTGRTVASDVRNQMLGAAAQWMASQTSNTTSGVVLWLLGGKEAAGK